MERIRNNKLYNKFHKSSCFKVSLLIQCVTMSPQWLLSTTWTAEDLHGKTVQFHLQGVPVIGRIEVETRRDGRMTVDVVDREGRESLLGFAHHPLTQNCLDRLIKSPHSGRPDFIVA